MHWSLILDRFIQNRISVPAEKHQLSSHWTCYRTTNLPYSLQWFCPGNFRNWEFCPVYSAQGDLFWAWEFVHSRSFLCCYVDLQKRSMWRRQKHITIWARSHISQFQGLLFFQSCFTRIAAHCGNYILLWQESTHHAALCLCARFFSDRIIAVLCHQI